MLVRAQRKEIIRNMAVGLRGLPVRVMNLKRRLDRKSTMRSLLLDIGFSDVKYIDAIDAEEIVKSGGRSKKVGKGMWRITYDVGGVRKTFKLKGNKLASTGSCEVFAQHACARSHRHMLVLAAKASGPILLCEDDWKIGPGIGSAVEVRKELTRVIRCLNKYYPRWCCLHLGSDPLWSNTHNNGVSKVAGISHASYVMQAHGVLWNLRVKDSRRLIQEVCDSIDRGFLADNAYASVMRKNPEKFFRCNPDLIIQDSRLASNLQLLSDKGGRSGYSRAMHLNRGERLRFGKTAVKRLNFKYRKNLGSQHRGVCRIKKQNLKRMRQEIGATGGKCRAGGGVTAKEIARKIANMKLYFDRFGEFPSKSECASRWSVGSELYSKTRASCIG